MVEEGSEPETFLPSFLFPRILEDLLALLATTHNYLVKLEYGC